MTNIVGPSQLQQMTDREQTMHDHIVESEENSKLMFEQMQQMHSHMRKALAGQQQLREELAKVKQTTKVTMAAHIVCKMTHLAERANE